MNFISPLVLSLFIHFGLVLSFSNLLKIDFYSYNIEAKKPIQAYLITEKRKDTSKNIYVPISSPEEVVFKNKDIEKKAINRIKTGLILNEFGEQNKIQVSEQEIQAEVQKQLRMMPGQEKMVMDFYQKNPSALASLRGTVYEEKILNLIKEKAKPNKKEISKDEAEKILKEAHNHDHNHDHDHDKKDKKKDTKKKAEAKSEKKKKPTPKASKSKSVTKKVSKK